MLIEGGKIDMRQAGATGHETGSSVAAGALPNAPSEVGDQERIVELEQERPSAAPQRSVVKTGLLRSLPRVTYMLASPFVGKGNNIEILDTCGALHGVQSGDARADSGRTRPRGRARPGAPVGGPNVLVRRLEPGGVLGGDGRSANRPPIRP